MAPRQVVRPHARCNVPFSTRDHRGRSRVAPPCTMGPHRHGRYTSALHCPYILALVFHFTFVVFFSSFIPAVYSCPFLANYPLRSPSPPPLLLVPSSYSSLKSHTLQMLQYALPVALILLGILQQLQYALPVALILLGILQQLQYALPIVVILLGILKQLPYALPVVVILLGIIQQLQYALPEVVLLQHILQ